MVNAGGVLHQHLIEDAEVDYADGELLWRQRLVLSAHPNTEQDLFQNAKQVSEERGGQVPDCPVLLEHISCEALLSRNFKTALLLLSFGLVQGTD